MRRKGFLTVVTLGLVLLLSGCFSKTAEDLFSLPKMPQDYVDLDNTINAVLSELGAEYAAPRTGDNTAPVQLQDLDGDGASESTIAFFRVNSGEQQLKIYIFHQNQDGTYEVAYTIEGSGIAINSVDYVDLDGNGTKEIVVSWQQSFRLYTLVPYQLGVTDAIELMVPASYNLGYIDCDLDRDNRRELLLFQSSETDPTEKWAEYYVYADGQMLRSATALLSLDAGTDTSIREGYLKDNIPAVYITTKTDNLAVTDVFALQDGILTNITLNERTGNSAQTMRYYTEVSPTDINADGILELPDPMAVKEYQSTAAAPNFWIIRWLQFDVAGNAELVQLTYHNFTDGWYLILPESWVGNITISRDNSQLARGEQAVVFSLWNGDEETEPQEFLRIYRLEGVNQELRAQLGNRFVLQSDNKLIYAAEFFDVGWDCGLDQENLSSHFVLSQTEWTS